MKKKIALFLSVLSVVMMLGACGTTDPTTVDYNGVTYDQLYEESVSLGTIFAGASLDDLVQEMVYLEYLEQNPDQNTTGADVDLYKNLVQKWMDAMSVSGNFVDLAENGFSVTKSGKTLTTDLILVFEDRNVVFQLVYNYHDMELTGVTIEPVYSVGEKMSKAGINTLICMSIVFAVLIFISLVITCFNIIPYLEAKKKEKQAALKATEVPEVKQEAPVVEQPLTDDAELVAAIAAAIAAYEGTSTDGFVVRSIRRR